MGECGGGRRCGMVGMSECGGGERCGMGGMGECGDGGGIMGGRGRDLGSIVVALVNPHRHYAGATFPNTCAGAKATGTCGLESSPRCVDPMSRRGWLCIARGSRDEVGHGDFPTLSRLKGSFATRVVIPMRRLMGNDGAHAAWKESFAGKCRRGSAHSTTYVSMGVQPRPPLTLLIPAIVRPESSAKMIGLTCVGYGFTSD